MNEFQRNLYNESISQQSLTLLIEKMKHFFHPDEIDHELLSVISKKYSLFSLLIEHLTSDRINISIIPNVDEILLFNLYGAKKLEKSIIQKIIPNFNPDDPKYLWFNDSNSTQYKLSNNSYFCIYPIPSFHQDIAKIIITDDYVSLLQMFQDESLKLDPNLYLEINDSLCCYTSIPFICYAAQNGSERCFQLLLRKGADITLTSQDKNSSVKYNSLHFGIISGNLDIMSNCLDMDLDYDLSSIFLAIKFHQNDILFDLLESSEFSDISYVPFLFSAIKWNNYAAFCELIFRSSAPLLDRNGCTPLHIAAQWGHTEMVRFLLKRFCAMIYVKDSHGI